VPATHVAKDVNSVPFASTAVIVTTAPIFNIGNVIVTFEGAVVTTDVAGITEALDDDSVYGTNPPFMIYVTLREMHCVFGVAGISAIPGINTELGIVSHF